MPLGLDHQQTLSTRPALPCFPGEVQGLLSWVLHLGKDRASSAALMTPRTALLPALGGKGQGRCHLSLTNFTTLYDLYPPLTPLGPACLHPRHHVQLSCAAQAGTGHTFPTAAASEGQGQLFCSHDTMGLGLLPVAGGDGYGGRKVSFSRPHNHTGKEW